MRDYQSFEVRNVSVIGHSGAGKTSVLEAMLYYTKATDRFGKTTEGSSRSTSIRKKFAVDYLFIQQLFQLNGKIVKLISLTHQVI